jgi:cytochrome c556
MKSSTWHVVLAAVMTIVLAGFGAAALAQDKEAVIKNRETLMKGQGKDIGSVKAYTEGKADLAQAEAGAAGLAQSTKKIPEVFPPGEPAPTGNTQPSRRFGQTGTSSSTRKRAPTRRPRRFSWP